MLKAIIVLAAFAKARLREFLTKEDGEVNIVAIVVLIGIAIVLAILFRNQITGLLNSLFGQVNESAKNAITDEA
jgi:ABC-type Mn2+/Zn2+ transport system permease subunit